MDMGPNSTFTAYSDDLVLIVVHKEMNKVEREVNWQLSRINEKMEQTKLEIAPEKSEAIVVSRRIQEEPIQIRIKEKEIRIKELMK